MLYSLPFPSLPSRPLPSPSLHFPPLRFPSLPLPSPPSIRLWSCLRSLARVVSSTSIALQRRTSSLHRRSTGGNRPPPRHRTPFPPPLAPPTLPTSLPGAGPSTCHQSSVSHQRTQVSRILYPVAFILFGSLQAVIIKKSTS